MQAPYAIGYAMGAEEQLDFLLAQQKPRNGARAVRVLIDKLDAAFETLSAFPRYGAVSSQERLAGLGYRKLVLYPFVLLYTMDDERHLIEIQGVFHHRQNYGAEL